MANINGDLSDQLFHFLLMVFLKINSHLINMTARRKSY